MAVRKKRARGKPVVRKHEVKADLANFELAKARSSLTLQIYANKEKIGALEIGRAPCIGKVARNKGASGSTGLDSRR
ncbi:MAG TPA: hypothetical protein VGT81_10260 [Casimicrobiaceae bacterium]|nr:hypothetical protein [Casimicrobiaceae bacterium]